MLRSDRRTELWYLSSNATRLARRGKHRFATRGEKKKGDSSEAQVHETIPAVSDGRHVSFFSPSSSFRRLRGDATVGEIRTGQLANARPFTVPRCQFGRVSPFAYQLTIPRAIENFVNTRATRREAFRDLGRSNCIGKRLYSCSRSNSVLRNA